MFAVFFNSRFKGYREFRENKTTAKVSEFTNYLIVAYSILGKLSWSYAQAVRKMYDVKIGAGNLSPPRLDRLKLQKY